MQKLLQPIGDNLYYYIRVWDAVAGYSTRDLVLKSYSIFDNQTLSIMIDSENPSRLINEHTLNRYRQMRFAKNFNKLDYKYYTLDLPVGEIDTRVADVLNIETYDSYEAYERIRAENLKLFNGHFANCHNTTSNIS